ncbi:MAG: hypothetical protein M1274_12295 [Actinobacteria bacterium]|nr:hypothetical protein [Actinomycetota bacterium]
MTVPGTEAPELVTGHVGGQAALAGFLYQILGTADCAVSVAEAGRPEPDCADALLTISGCSHLVQEAFGQDAALLSDESNILALVQFKYAGDGSSRPIGQEELLRVVHSFKTSLADSLQADKATALILITNRPLGDSAETLREAAISGLPHCLLGERSTQKKAEREILEQLEIRELSLDTALLALEQRAAKLGLLPHEVEEGIDRLVGHLLARVRQFTCLDRHRVDVLITGAETIREITRESVSAFVRAQIQAYGQQIEIEPASTVRREEVADLQNLEEAGLIILTGLGGTGKSVALHQFLTDLVDAGLAYCALPLFGVEYSDRSIPNLIDSLRGVTSNDTWQIALHRLERANTSSMRPIMLIAIDALDEVQPRNEAAIGPLVGLLKGLWADFQACTESGQKARAIVVVSCRREEELNWIWLHRGHAFKKPHECLRIGLHDFTDLELGEAVRLCDLPADVATRIQSEVLRRIADEDGTQPPLALGVNLSPAPPIPPLAYESLLIPRFWQLFRTNEDPELQLAFVKGEPVAMQRFAELFLDTFVVRLNQIARIDSERARTALTSIAEANRAKTRPLLYNPDWIEVAISTGALTAVESGNMYKEAHDFGIIVSPTGGEWEWRLPFVRQSG